MEHVEVGLAAALAQTERDVKDKGYKIILLEERLLSLEQELAASHSFAVSLGKDMSDLQDEIKRLQASRLEEQEGASAGLVETLTQSQQECKNLRDAGASVVLELCRLMEVEDEVRWLKTEFLRWQEHSEMQGEALEAMSALLAEARTDAKVELLGQLDIAAEASRNLLESELKLQAQKYEKAAWEQISGLCLDLEVLRAEVLDAQEGRVAEVSAHQLEVQQLESIQVQMEKELAKKEITIVSVESDMAAQATAMELANAGLWASLLEEQQARGAYDTIRVQLERNFSDVRGSVFMFQKRVAEAAVAVSQELTLRCEVERGLREQISVQSRELEVSKHLTDYC